jgi:predicted nucleic acid-binding protein
MRSDCFLDTNILIYAAAGKQDDPRKFHIAERIVSKERFGLSAQVLAEFYVNIRRKPKIPPSRQEVDRWIDLLCEFPIAAVDEALVKMGILYSQRFAISYFDAAIIAAAERLGASVLYTEDLNHGQLYGAVRVVNPFKAS